MSRQRLATMLVLMLFPMQAWSQQPVPEQPVGLLWIYRLAESNDPGFRAAEAAYRAELEVRAKSRARLMPTLDIQAGVTNNGQEVLRADAGGWYSTGDTFDSRTTRYSLNVTQPVFHFDRFVGKRQAKVSVARAEAGFAAQRQGLMMRVAEAYFGVLAARDAVRFAEAEKTAIERQLEQTRQRFEVGLIAITDVHEAQAAYDLATARAIEAANGLFSAREGLRQLTGSETRLLHALRDEMMLVSPEPDDIDVWTARAEEGNLLLREANYAFRVAGYAVRMVESGHMPTVDVTASYARNEVDGGFSGGRETDDTVVAVQMNIPVFNGGDTRARVREAQQRRNEARYRVEQQRRATVRLTRDAYRSVLADIGRVKALRQAVVSANSALSATEAGYEVGTRTAVDVLDSRRELFRAQGNYSRARYDYLLNTLRLKLAVGQLSIDDVKHIDAMMKAD